MATNGTLSLVLSERYDDLTAKLIASRLRWVSPILAAVVVVDGTIEILDSNLSATQWVLATLIRLCGFGALLLIWRLSVRLVRLGALRLLSYAFVMLFCLAALLLQLVYPEPLNVGASAYLGVMLISFFLLPWRVRDCTIIAAAAMVAYTLEALDSGDFYEVMQYGTNMLILLVVGFLAIILKRDDERRRLHEFRLQNELQEANEQMERDLKLARHVHLSLIPKSANMKEAEVAVTYAPMWYVGGDYANFLMAGEGRLVFFMSDVSGHGVSAALIANRIHSEVERLMKEPMGPGTLLDELDSFVSKQLGDTRMFLSAFSGVVDFHQKRLAYSNHGHPPQILYQSREGALSLMKPISPVLGLGIPGPSPQESEMGLPLDHGDLIVLFTDGITETHGRAYDLFGLERLEEFVASHASLPPEQFNAALTSEIKAFRDGPIEDDVFLLTIRVK